MASEPDWVSPEELDLFAQQPSIKPSVTDEALAMRIFRDNLPIAAEVICHLAVNAEKENTKLNAAKYVVDRVLGRIGEAKTDNEVDALAELFGTVMREPTAEERATGSRVSRL